MNHKIINCPHCGKIIKDTLTEKPESQPLVKYPEYESQKLYKSGTRCINKGEIQRYLCRECCYRFSNKKV